MVELAVVVTCDTGADPANNAPAFKRSGTRLIIGCRAYAVSESFGAALAGEAATIGTTLSASTRVYVRGAISNGISGRAAIDELGGAGVEEDELTAEGAGTASDRTIQ